MASPLDRPTVGEALSAGWRAAPALLLLMVVLIFGYVAVAPGKVVAIGNVHPTRSPQSVVFHHRHGHLRLKAPRHSGIGVFRGKLVRENTQVDR